MKRFVFFVILTGLIAGCSGQSVDEQKVASEIVNQKEPVTIDEGEE